MKIDRLFVVSLGAITGLASCSSGQEEEAQRPNILILLADDAGYADFGFMGATDIQTPNIDRLAAEGCIFTDAHVAATVSSPLCCICPLPLPILPMKRRKRIWRVSKDSPARSMRL